jgi:hypothetical protein
MSPSHDRSLARQRRIRSLSFGLMLLSLVALLYQLFWAASTWVLPVVSLPLPSYLEVSDHSHGPRRTVLDLSGSFPRYRPTTLNEVSDGYGIQPNRTTLARWLAFLHVLYGVLGSWLLVRLFSAYRRLGVFEVASVRKLRDVGLWLAGGTVRALVFNFTKPWWSDGIPGMMLIDWSSGGLFAGAFIVLVAWIMEEACVLAEEQALTV